MNLHMVEMQVEPGGLMRFVQAQGLLRDHELGYAIHAWLKAAFGEKAPKPWRLFWRRRVATRVLAYSRAPAEELQAHLREFADPLVHSVLLENGLASKSMPRFAPGRRLQFEALCCPVGRQARTGAEKDIFLLRVEQARVAGGKTLNRDSVYREWLQDHVEGRGGAKLVTSRVAGFQLVAPLRKGGANRGERSFVQLHRPSVLFEGELEVVDSDMFTQLLAHGIGRHRAFGFGMVLLRPTA